MSTEAFVEGRDFSLGAWETEGQIYFTRLRAGALEKSDIQSPAGRGGKRKHPALAVSTGGETIVVWTEGTGWQRGGSLAWQIYDRAGKPTDQKGRKEGAIPVWGLPTVVAEKDSGFTIIH